MKLRLSLVALLPWSLLLSSCGVKVSPQASDSGARFAANSSFTVNPGGPYSGLTNESIQLAASSSGGKGRVRYQWDLNNDGSFETSGQTAVVTYSQTGSFLVRVKGVDNKGSVAVASTSVVVSEQPAPGPLSVSVSGAATAAEGAQVPLAAQPTGGQPPYSYEWRLNGGAYQVGGVSQTVLLQDNGVYSVTVRVLDSRGASAEATHTLSASNVPPTVTGTSYTGTVAAPVSFSPSVQDPSSVDTSAGFSYSWSFGDGATSSERTPAHAYGAAGEYQATLVVTDKDGGSGQAVFSVSIQANPPPPDTPGAQYVVSTSGNDSNPGTASAPWRTLARALQSATSGDTINLRAGSYSGGLYITNPGILIRSYPGERAEVVGDSSANNLYLAADGIKVSNLDIRGGYYGVKIDRSHCSLENVKLSESFYFGVKIVPGANYATIKKSEFFNTGTGTGAGAIDDVNGHYLVAEDNYIHDIPGDGFHLKGGLRGMLIQRNLIRDAGGTGILVGQSTGTEFMTPSENPEYYENIDAVVRNNIVMRTSYAGIGLWAALRPKVYNNTLIDTAQVGQGALFMVPVSHGSFPTATNRDVTFVNNIIARTGDASRPSVFIVSGGLTGTLVMDHNRYYNAGAGGGTAFWDERVGLYGSFSRWVELSGVESGSSTGDPGVDTTGHLTAASACIDAGRNVSDVTDDVDGSPRTNTFDIGADERQ